MVDRWRVLAALLTTRWRRFGTRAALQRHQQRRLHRVLGRARSVFPFYADLGGSALTDLPVLEKLDWLRHFGDLNDRGLSLDECLEAARTAEAARTFDAVAGGVSVGLSSGTSGHRGVFLTSDQEQARWAGVMLAKALPTLRKPARVALVLRSGGPLYRAVEGGRVAFEFVDLALPPDAINERLIGFAPTVLAAPPQVLDDLAARAVRPRPQVIYSIADVLDDDVARRIELGFARPVGQVYQATEGFLGITCAHGTLHLNEDLLHIEREPLDAATGRFTPVVTDLYRTSQAIIRYRLGDVLLPGRDDCPCGSVLATVGRIEGRVDDVLRFPDASGAEQSLFGRVVQEALMGVPGVLDFRLVQRPDHVLRLAVRPQRAQSSGHLALQRLIESHGLVVSEITGMPWPVESALDKRRRIRREV